MFNTVQLFRYVFRFKQHICFYVRNQATDLVLLKGSYILDVFSF